MTIKEKTLELLEANQDLIKPGIKYGLLGVGLIIEASYASPQDAFVNLIGVITPSVVRSLIKDYLPSLLPDNPLAQDGIFLGYTLGTTLLSSTFCHFMFDDISYITTTIVGIGTTAYLSETIDNYIDNFHYFDKYFDTPIDCVNE